MSIKTGDEDTAAEPPLISRTDMEWRTVNSFGIDSLYFETFHGGGDVTWVPTRACHMEFGRLRVDAE